MDGCAAENFPLAGTAGASSSGHLTLQPREVMDLLEAIIANLAQIAQAASRAERSETKALAGVYALPGFAERRTECVHLAMLTEARIARLSTAQADARRHSRTMQALLERVASGEPDAPVLLGMDCIQQIFTLRSWTPDTSAPGAAPGARAPSLPAAGATLP